MQFHDDWPKVRWKIEFSARSSMYFCCERYTSLGGDTVHLNSQDILRIFRTLDLECTSKKKSIGQKNKRISREHHWKSSCTINFMKSVFHKFPDLEWSHRACNNFLTMSRLSPQMDGNLMYTSSGILAIRQAVVRSAWHKNSCFFATIVNNNLRVVLSMTGLPDSCHMEWVANLWFFNTNCTLYLKGTFGSSPP